MFTGIVEETGIVHSIEQGKNGCVLSIDGVSFGKELVPGESVSINGACMTVTESWGSGFRVDVSLETLSVTRMGKFLKAERVNLERAMRLSDRLGGHLVLGHVDGLGTLESHNRQGETEFLQVAVPYSHRAFVIPKGSIALDGISLTVNRIHDHPGRQLCLIELAIIPHTLEVTNLGDRKLGDELHLEYDVVGKYILRAREMAIPGFGDAQAMGV
uniref:Riboflavin synthase n=1 Tax=Leptospirillum ferriphilum TaxID=178606 RepID=A0A7C3QRQ9_9BACT